MAAVKPQAPDRHPVLTYVSPGHDVVFYVVRDSRIPGNKSVVYGTPYRDTGDFPNHKLCYVAPADEAGWQKWYYAAERSSQEAYNFRYAEGDVTLTRDYVVLRSELANFTQPSMGTADPAFPAYKFATREVLPVQDESLESLFVVCRHIYSRMGVVIARDSKTNTGWRLNGQTTIDAAPVSGKNSSSSYEQRGWVNKTDSVAFTWSSAATSIETKPYVTLRTTMTASPTPQLPATGIGESKLVFDDGETKVYENTDVDATARPGPAGQDIDTKAYVRIITDKRYSTTPDIATSSGSANVIYNDGEAIVYEVGEVRSIGRYGPAGEEVDKKAYVTLTTEKVYSANSTVTGNSGSSNLIYDDGTTKVYEVNNVSAAARPGPAGFEKDEKPWVSIRTDKRYDSSNTVATATGAANIVFNDGVVQVYEISEVTSTPKEQAAGSEKDRKPYLDTEVLKRYSTSNAVTSSTGSSRIIYDDGQSRVFEISEIVNTARESDAGEEKERRPYVEITKRQRYSQNNTVTTTTGSSDVVFDDGTVQVYRITEVQSTARPGEGGMTERAEPWGTVTTAITYGTTPTLSRTGQSRVVYDDGTTRVYEKSEETAAASGITFVSAKSANRLLTKTVTTRYSTDPVGTDDYESSVIYRDKDVTIYKTDSAVLQSKGPVTYQTVVTANVPSTLRSLTLTPIIRKDDRTRVRVETDIEEGYTGSFPARVTEFFTTDPNAGAELPMTFKPRQVVFQGVLVNVSIGETLHSAFSITENIGTTDPDFAPQTYTKTFPATEPASVPSGWQLYRITTEPYETGYIVRRIDINYKGA